MSDKPWYDGCDNCKHGIVRSIDLTGAVSFYLERIVLMLREQIEFCECRAGKAAKAQLMNARQKLIEEARKDYRQQKFAERDTHVDIENAKIKIDQCYLIAAPSIHFEGTPP